MKELVPGAEYTHCKAHCLNLVISHACKLPIIRNMLDIVQQVAFAFHYSAKRVNVFKDELCKNLSAKAAMEKRQKLQTLCETRWASRANALFTFKASLEVIDDTLEKLANELADTKARSFAASIERFDFILPLVVCEHVLQIIAPLSEMLQAKECDLIEATKETKTVRALLQNERNDDSAWDSLYQSAIDLAAVINIAPSLPRRNVHQIHRDNVPADSPSTCWKRAVYYQFYDHVTQELNDRLLVANDRFLAQYLIPTNLGTLTPDIATKLYCCLNNDMPMSPADFDTELRRWKARWSLEETNCMPNTLQATLNETNPSLYPGVYIALNILSAMPVSTASAERSFSVMRRVKNYLRSTMTTERLSGLAVIHAHKDMDINTDKVLEDFASRSNRRLLFLFQQ